MSESGYNIQNITPYFYRGDIVDLIQAPPVTEKKINNIRKVLFSANPYKLIILRHLGDNLYLVAICKETSRKTQFEVNTNKKTLYVKAYSFFSIDASSLRLCADMWFKNNKSQVVEDIYILHNGLVEKRRFEQRERKRKQRETVQKKVTANRQAKQKQKKLEEQYKQSYEIAVMNNDRKRMKEIEEIVGYAPGRKVPSGSNKRKGKVQYATFNPLPYNSGRFSPK